MKAYKAIAADGTTRGGMTWEIDKTNRATGGGAKLCTDGVLHVYRTPMQAAFMIPAHVPGYTRLLEVEVPEIVADDGTKCGVKEAMPVREIPMPILTTEQRVEIAIRVSLAVYHCADYQTWADRWLTGRDRSDAAYAADAADAADAAAYAAAYAAKAAADAAAYAAADAAADAAAYAAAYAAKAAKAAAAAAAYAAPIDLLSIIEQVVSPKEDPTP